jgi:hypothetical protein
VSWQHGGMRPTAHRRNVRGGDAARRRGDRSAAVLVAACGSGRAGHRPARGGGLPQAGGLTWGKLTDLVGAALSTRDCLGWTLRIYNPDLDPDRAGAWKIVDFVGQFRR